MDTPSVSEWFPSLPSDRVRAVGRPLLAISGIHGDLAALDAVLSAHGEGELCGIVAAGDHCYGGADPFGVWRRLLDEGVTLVRGETDLALGTLSAQRLPTGDAEVEVRHDGLGGRVQVARYRPGGPEDEARLQTFLETADALGEIICRRLGELPSTAVVSLDGRAGVMITHGSPADAWRALTPEMSEIELVHEVGCTAEDALVVGRDPRGFVREAGPVLVVGAGSVGLTPHAEQLPKRRRAGPRARATLIQEFSDGKVRARVLDVEVPGRQQRTSAAAEGRLSDDRWIEAERVLGYTFTDRALLEEALTHRSYVHEHVEGGRHNERLEFLGDAVLGFVAARRLFDDRPAAPEGELTRQRAAYVSEHALHSAEAPRALGKLVRMGKGQLNVGGDELPSIVSDATEAVIAAVYLDGGLEAAETVIATLLGEVPDAAEETVNPKGRLQERFQALLGEAPTYDAERVSGPDHKPMFAASALMRGRSLGRAEGANKKEATLAAAAAALEQIEGLDDHALLRWIEDGDAERG